MKHIRILTLLLLCNIFIVPSALAQAKPGKSVFTLTTFKPDGTILASTNGVFVGSEGEAVSAWTPFVGAARAVCIDADGQSHNVEAIYGANELYDVCRFRVSYINILERQRELATVKVLGFYDKEVYAYVLRENI
ncbi:MAG: hypothetical protein IKH48_02535, partial [Prevotella sp.]|nr:hypothetical protein [Prevotella sp.]